MIENILLILLLLLLSAKIVGSIFEKFGLDSAVGEILTGIIFGSSVLNLISPESIKSFAIIGSVLILFIAGIKQQNIKEIYKDKLAISLGIFLLVITGVIMTLFFYFIPQYFGIKFTLIQSLVLGLAFSIVDVGLPAKILISKDLINTHIGRITVRSAITNILVGLFLFTLITTTINLNLSDILIKIFGIVSFFVSAIILIYSLSRISKFITRIPIEEAEFSLAFVLILALAYFTEVIGFSSILGAFIAGVLIAKMPFSETTSFSYKIKSLSFGLFIPLFFVWFGLEINLAEIWKHITLALLIFFTYIAIRFTITYMYLKKNKLKMPLLISSSMLSVDVESLVILMIALQLGIFITNIPLTLFAPSVLFSTLLIVILVSVFSKMEKHALTKIRPQRK